MNKLSEQEFESTFTPPMTDITDTAEVLVNIWPYFDEVLASDFSDAETDSWDVEYVYMNLPETHQHILINTGMENIYLVVVIDATNKSIFGHHLLNLNQKYGLTH